MALNDSFWKYSFKVLLYLKRKDIRGFDKPR